MDVLIYIVQNSLPVMVPLLLVALGGMFSERSGVINIALEGIMLVGAFAGTLCVYFVQGTNMGVQTILLIGMVVAGMIGALYAILLGVAAVHLKADQTITGTALNMLVPAFMLLVCKMAFMSDGVTTNVKFYIQKIPVLGDIPVIGELFFCKTYASVGIGVVILMFSAFFFYKTKLGLRLRACGEHPQAADSVGINVYKMRYLGVILSGLLGGIGGFFYVVNIMDGNSNGHTGVAGFGFLALAVMIFGQWKPLLIALAALFFAFLRTVAYSVPLIPFLANLGIDNAVYKMLPYIATMIILAFTSEKSRAPKAEGIPYDKGLR
ncbi:MAG: ABC transporter permease [Lachnospiraceae bacterium]|nr:ABC transporter permease [Lachnospiraceae bacterium]